MGDTALTDQPLLGGRGGARDRQRNNINRRGGRLNKKGVNTNMEGHTGLMEARGDIGASGGFLYWRHVPPV